MRSPYGNPSADGKTDFHPSSLVGLAGFFCSSLHRFSLPIAGALQNMVKRASKSAAVQ
jgi:hypothetical protein